MGSCWGQLGFDGWGLARAASWCLVLLGRLAALFHQVKKSITEIPVSVGFLQPNFGNCWILTLGKAVTSSGCWDDQHRSPKTHSLPAIALLIETACSKHQIHQSSAFRRAPCFLCQQRQYLNHMEGEETKQATHLALQAMGCTYRNHPKRTQL